jgi:hypothetical protein
MQPVNQIKRAPSTEGLFLWIIMRNEVKSMELSQKRYRIKKKGLKQLKQFLGSEPRSTVPLFQRGMSASADRGILMGSSHWRFKCPLCSKPIKIPHPRGELPLGKGACYIVICTFLCRVIRIPSAAEPRSTVPLFQRRPLKKSKWIFALIFFRELSTCSRANNRQ